MQLWKNTALTSVAALLGLFLLPLAVAREPAEVPEYTELPRTEQTAPVQPAVKAVYDADPVLPEGTVRRHFSISGQVQGVGFRYRARYAAQALELTGWVENEDDGSVTLEVQGDPDKFPELFAMIQRSDYVRITDIRQKDLPPDPWERGFSVRGY